MQASVEAVETREVPTADAAPAPAEAPAFAAPTATSRLRRRLPQGAIELIGLAFGISIISAVALGSKLSNDEFWQMAAGQWMLAHHAVVGLDPFSYTEAHRRWVTDEWGSEVALGGLFRAFGNAAYATYAIVLGALSLGACALYARALGARGGRVAAIVIVLAAGISGVMAGDRGLDFSLVWLPFELFVLTKARSNPRWLWCLPPLCLAWVNTHGSILFGLIVLGAELGWSLVPERHVARIGGVGQSSHTGPLALALLGSVVASCLTPYGPGLLAYDVGVSRNSQIAQYILEWNSPNFHSFMVLLAYCVPLAVLAACAWTRRLPVLEASLGVVLFLEALQTQRLVIYLMVVAVGLAASLPMRRAWGSTARRVAGACFAVVAIAILATPSVPPGTVNSSLPVQAFDYLSMHPGRIFTTYTWGDYSIARHRATFVDGRTDLFEGPVLTTFFNVTNLETPPDPVFERYDVSYVVWAPNTALSLYLSHDPRWRVVDRSSVALVFARSSP
ncbi:MAG TPA: hypothetical protein VHS57_04620 [Acidimicrobiales bacterium]|nr:hypothetical protein [Acidimicrobiales bacterium]